MPVTITLAKQSSTGNILHIREANKTKEDSFSCVGCGKELIAVKSVAKKRDWHFRHKIESDCTGGRDTALHEYAVQILMESNKIQIKKNFSIEYSNPRKEVSVLGKRSDVTVSYEDRDVHFEVFVTHDLDKEKIGVYRQNQINCIKIDLSNKMYLSESPELIKDTVLNKENNKVIVYWYAALKYEGKPKSETFLNYFLIAIGILTSFFLLRWLFKNKTKNIKHPKRKFN